MITYRTKIITGHRCPRSRYLMLEADGTGYELKREGVPLATGGAIHESLAGLLKGLDPRVAINLGLTDFDQTCESRGLQLQDLKEQSFVYAEQRSLVEGLGWLAALKVVPKLLETYEILEVEKMDQVQLTETIQFRAIPDALMRNREDGDLYLLSWKTPAQVPKDNDPRTDMQGLSEAWAVETRLKGWFETGDDAPDWFVKHIDAGGQPKIRGIQMVYLLKGRRVDHITLDGLKVKRHDSPLIWGWTDESFPPNFASSMYYNCEAPHPMRKSQWYPTGMCETPGKRHERKGNWKIFPVSQAMGVQEWMRMIDSGEIQGSLETEYVIPIPYYRTDAATKSWLRQITASEKKVESSLDFLRPYEQEIIANPDDLKLKEAFSARLDESFPQHTEQYCNDTYKRPCPMWGVCYEDQDPKTDPLYQIRVETKHAAPEDED